MASFLKHEHIVAFGAVLGAKAVPLIAAVGVHVPFFQNPGNTIRYRLYQPAFGRVEYRRFSDYIFDLFYYF